MQGWPASASPSRPIAATPPPPLRLINSEKSQLHCSPHREVRHMAEWGAQPQNYHIKPGFPQTLWGARAVDTDSDEREKKKKKKSIMKIKVLKPSLAITVIFQIMGLLSLFIFFPICPRPVMMDIMQGAATPISQIFKRVTSEEICRKYASDGCRLEGPVQEVPPLCIFEAACLVKGRQSFILRS